MPDSRLKTTFNRAALLYEEIRPGYPDELIKDIVDLSGISSHGKILEIGCGTGQATRAFAAFGHEMLCIDIGPGLIDIAKERFREFPNVTFLVCAFEEWKPDQNFDLLISATAFRWIDPEVRYIKAWNVLNPDGALATFSNRHVRWEGFFVEVQEVYRKYAPQLCVVPLPDQQPPPPSPEPGVERFLEPVQRTYPWAQEYSSEQYVKLLGTYSDHLALPESNREPLFKGIKDLIDEKYGGAIMKHYESVFDFRKKKT
jgi:ubiquinone/menaquinone biosynthesis C-methylase UbiE